jgi:dUTP pyrophosphatase
MPDDSINKEEVIVKDQRVEVDVRVLEHAAGLPEYQTPGAVGMDLCAAIGEDDAIILKPDTALHDGWQINITKANRVLIPTGIAVSCPDSYEFQVRTRSGLALKHGVTTVNAPGTIDQDYRGEIHVILHNEGDKPYVIK